MTKYYVFNPNRSKPTVSYDNYDDALKEAERLAEKEDVFFEVLKVVGLVEVERKIKVTEYLKNVDIGFWNKDGEYIEDIQKIDLSKE